MCCFSLLCCLSNAMADDRLAVSDFSKSGLEGWETKVFSGATSYREIRFDRQRVIKAESHDGASGLIKKIHVDLEKYPYLNWSWRIDDRLDIKNEKQKSGDDFAARIYVVIDGGIWLWRTRAVNYVWASGVRRGETWANPFAGRHSIMIAVRNGQDKTSTWYAEKRNVYADLKRLFGDGYRFIDAVAIMTDTDNSHGQAVSYYGDIYFSAE